MASNIMAAAAAAAMGGARGLGDLPDELVAEVLKHLQPADLAALALADRAHAALSKRDGVWKALMSMTRMRVPVHPRQSFRRVYIDRCRSRERMDSTSHFLFLKGCYDMLCKRDSVAGECYEHQRSVLGMMVDDAVALITNSLLNLASRCSALRCIQELVEVWGADIETSDGDGFTPLLNAAWRGELRICKYLLSKGADVSAKGVYKSRGPFDACEWASIQGHTTLAKELQKHQRITTNSTV
eukprot:jgi/Chlat1/2918/Chrsp2S04670